MGSRRLRWMAGGGVFVCAAALAVVGACRSGGEEQRPPGEPPPPPLTAAALAPVFGTLGPEGVVPQRLVVELARPIAEQGAGEAKAGATRLVLEPEVEGELTRTGPSTLAFVPDEPFAPGTTYQATLVQVQTSDGKTLAAPREGWRHRFTTPRFQLARLALAGVEYNARWADVDLVFSAAVDPDTVRERVRALLVDSRLARARGLFRTVFFAPVVTTLVAVAVVWRYLYHPRFGLFNYLLGLVGVPPIDWLGRPVWAMVAITLLAAWRSFGYALVIYVAGLQSIPRSLYEAAELDGAGPWRRFREITLPLLAPTTLFVGVITTVGLFQVFAEPYVMTRGGPLNATTSVALLMYEQGFRWWSMGSAAAVAFVLFAMVLLVSAAQIGIRRLIEGAPR